MSEVENSENKIIVFDIGGTTSRSSLYQDGKLIDNIARVPTKTLYSDPKLTVSELQAELLKNLITQVGNFKKRFPQISKVTVAIAGPVLDNSTVVAAPSIWDNPGINFPLKKKLESEIADIDVFVANDLTAATERYAQQEENKAIDYFALITISTGVGVKIFDVKNQTVTFEPTSLAEEIGHREFTTSGSEIDCDCGGKNHLNVLSSGRGLERQLRLYAKQNSPEFQKSSLAKLGVPTEKLTIYQFSKAVKAGDFFACELLSRSTLPLVETIFDLYQKKVRKFIIVGGFALNLGETYLATLTNNVGKNPKAKDLPPNFSSLLMLGNTDDSDALIGVGLLAEALV